MRHTPLFDVTDPEVVTALIDANPWATIVSHTAAGELVASHYPVLRDTNADGIVLLTHVGQPDDQVHEFRDEPVLVIFQGAAHGYISPTWYSEDEAPVATWNFSAVHCHGVPEQLGSGDNLAVLARLTDHFEQHVPERRHLDLEVAARIASRTVGLRIPVDRFTCKVKMSQNKSGETRDRVIAALERDGEPFADPSLAAEMRRVLGLPSQA
jgi:transcriptional regulator